MINIKMWLLFINIHLHQYQMSTNAIKEKISFDILQTNHLRFLFDEVIRLSRITKCFAIITDDWYEKIYDGDFFYYIQSQSLTWYYIKINLTEDLLSPSYQTVRILKEIKKSNCDLHFITLLNGLQVQRFLLFVEKYRILNFKYKYIFIYDKQLIVHDMLQIWNKILNGLFITIDTSQYTSFRISTIHFPSILNGIIAFKHLFNWTKGLRLRHTDLFFNRLTNLKGYNFPVAVYDHLPMVIESTLSKDHYTGLEIKIVQALGKALNFMPNFYQPKKIQQQNNESYTYLIEELVKGNAVMAIGDIHLFTIFTAMVDFSIPHSYECLTFLTPASSQDNSWKTFILPFHGNMWAGVLLSLFLVGSIFYVLSFFHAVFIRHQNGKNFFKIFRKSKRNKTLTFILKNPKILYNRKFRLYLNRLKFPNAKQNDLFDHFPNCILLTYSMLMYVALPSMPKNWSLRILTGWYWIYCILLTVAYRASFTAILANPASRIAVDTLKELTQSQLNGMVASMEDQNLFRHSFDDNLRKLSTHIQIININKCNNNDLTKLIGKGGHAYYDNKYYLRHLRWNDDKNQLSSSLASTSRTSTTSETDTPNDVLHIMKDCIIRMPTGLAIARNSPFKILIDKYMRRLMEFGLIQKWLKDVIEKLPTEEESPQEAFIDLHKFWGIFVPLCIGYLISIILVIFEIYYFHRIVSHHPLYDIYNPRLYYNFLRKYEI